MDDTTNTDSHAEDRILDKIPRHGIYGGIDNRDWNLRSGMRSQNYQREGFDRGKFESNYDQIDWSEKSITKDTK